MLFKLPCYDKYTYKYKIINFGFLGLFVITWFIIAFHKFFLFLWVSNMMSSFSVLVLTVGMDTAFSLSLILQFFNFIRLLILLNQLITLLILFLVFLSSTLIPYFLKSFLYFH